MFKYSFAFLLVFVQIGVAQVIINDTSTSPASAFTISSDDKGVLIPKISLSSVDDTQIDGVHIAADGLLIYNTNASVIGGDGNGYYLFSQSLNKWEKILTPGSTVGILPIGSIIAWHNTVDIPSLTLPDGWVLCNGATIIDSESPLNGIVTPSLNNTTTATSGDSSYGRFLRGGTTSGIFQSDQTNNLQQIIASGTSSTSTSLFLNQNGFMGYISTDDWNGLFGRDRYGFQMRGVENRVTNMTVQWIMRIK